MGQGADASIITDVIREKINEIQHVSLGRFKNCISISPWSCGVDNRSSQAYENMNTENASSQYSETPEGEQGPISGISRPQFFHRTI